MLYIDDSTQEVKNAINNHLSYWSCRITKKLTGAHCLNRNCDVCNSTNKSNSYIEAVNNFVFNNDRLKQILTGKPDVLKRINTEFLDTMFKVAERGLLNDYFSATKQEKKNAIYSNIKSVLDYVQSAFDYKFFIGLEPRENYSSYHLAKALNRSSCTYCNRAYTTTMESRSGGKLMRPQFDHWFPKSKYPLLAISFYNLIPSCYTCNSSAKGDLELSLNEHIHPYIDKTSLDSFKFNYIFFKRIDEYRLLVERKGTNEKAIKTIRQLEVDTMYKTHIDELADLIKIKQAYSDKYIELMQNFFPKSSLSKQEVFRLLFGTELDSKDFHKRPLSKFKNDILQKLDII
jgi:hypothetical protein